MRFYLGIAVITGFSIAFILNAFQPFGTQNFQHPYKSLILSGYGIVSTSVIAIYYSLSLKLLHAHRAQRWTVLKESIDLFLVLVISLLACYFYFIWVFNGHFSLQQMGSFLLRAVLVSILPVLSLFAYITSKYKGIIRSSMEIDETIMTDSKSRPVTLKGTNKHEVIQTTEDEILHIKAEDNYVILSIRNDETVQSHMIRSTLKQMEDQLSDYIFMKCHRSYIINSRRISGISGNKNSAKVKIRGSEQLIPVSRTKVDLIRGIIENG